MPLSCMRGWGEFGVTSAKTMCCSDDFTDHFSTSYSVFRTIDDYYADGEAAYDMRKPLGRDKERGTVRENGKNVHVEPYRVW